MQYNENYSECEQKYLKKHFKIYKSKRFKRKIAISFLILAIIFSFIIFYLVKIINPIIYSYGESNIKKLITKSSNNAISSAISNLNYKDFIEVSYDSNGDIKTLKADIVKINQISNNLAKFTQEELDDNSKLGINIPIGTFTGISFLLGKGSNVNLTVNPIGNATCDFFTSFESAGINQTSHKIFVVIEAEASLILPFGFKKIKQSTEYLISECVLVGKIPNVYLNSSNLNNFK